MVRELFTSNDATGLAKLVRQREVSALDLVDEAIRRIEALNPRLNAVVHRLYDYAREVATRPLPDGPLAGVPILLKDLSVEWKGFPVTNGSRYFKNYVASTDWEISARMRNAGLIPVGKTNVPENGWCAATEPVLFGSTVNPWNAGVVAGGSSGGSAVAVASGMVPLADASDGGGSIRIPAANNGIVGLKPSRGRVTFGPGVVDYWYGAVAFLCVSRSVRDTASYLDVVAGAHPGDPYALPKPQASYLSAVGQRPKRLRIGVAHSEPDGEPLNFDVKAAVEKASDLCRQLGHEVIEHDFRYDVEVFKSTFGRITAVLSSSFFQGCAERFGRVTPDDVEPATWGIIELGKTVSGVQHATDIEIMRKMSRDLVESLRPYDVFLAPVQPVPPRPAGWYDMSEPDIQVYNERLMRDIVFTAPFNITGQPAITLPLHRNANDIPVGIQFVAPVGDEATLLNLSAQIEEAQPWKDIRPPAFYAV
ncbi:amidase [Phyllobacterium sophorae]|uniref:Indoleacetamide hydrolase n=1 Tax=Phyllobacterium sophorae TaxID=1520277 RepID=A0A2P7B6T1_9HYPH|nr:amidase [Phyllobacterium sophorae]PSH62177.1 amidase [Phyllobacterium sophorae]